MNLLYVVLACVMLAVVVSATRKYMHSPSRLPPLQAMLYFLKFGSEYDVREPVRAQGLVDALKRAGGAPERQKCEDILRTVVEKGPPSQVQPALAAAWALGFGDFEKLLETAVARECLTRDAWDSGLELLKTQLKA